MITQFKYDFVYKENYSLKKIIPLKKKIQWPFKLPAKYQCILKSERYYSHLNAYDCYALFHFIYGSYDLLTSNINGSLFSIHPNLGQIIPPYFSSQYFPNISAHLILLIHWRV